MKIACRRTAGEIYESLVLAYEAHKVRFILAHDPDDTFWVRLGPGELVTLHGFQPSGSCGDTWDTAYWLARIFRDTDGLNWICNVPIEVLGSQANTDEDYFPWAEGLQELHLAGRDPRSLVQDAIDMVEATMVNARTVGSPDDDRDFDWDNDWDDLCIIRQNRDRIQRISLPAYRTLASLLDEDETGFNANLLNAVQLHQNYWDYDGEDGNRSRNPTGYIALALTGIAALAHDRGMRVTVESDYLPGYLVQGAFPYPPV